MALVLLLILGALVIGGVGLAIEAVRWLLIIAIVLLVLSAISYRRW